MASRKEISFKNGNRLQLINDGKTPAARGMTSAYVLYLKAKDIPDLNSLIYGEVFHPHDHVSCQALQDYETDADFYDRTNRPVPRGLMTEYALRNGTTIDEMKKHWRCIEQLKKYKPDTQ